MGPRPRNTNDDGRIDAGRRAARFRLTDAARQGETRAEMRDVLDRGGVPREVADDVLVVVSELSANATEHAGAAEVQVELVVHDHEVWLLVLHHDPGGIEPEALGEVSMPRGDAGRGRGLAIVEALTSSVEHRRHGDAFATECRFAVG